MESLKTGKNIAVERFIEEVVLLETLIRDIRNFVEDVLSSEERGRIYRLYKERFDFDMESGVAFFDSKNGAKQLRDLVRFLVANRYEDWAIEMIEDTIFAINKRMEMVIDENVSPPVE